MRSDAETERYRLFDAVAAWLSAASADRPLLLVLDDLHWGSSPTLLLTRHLARSTDPLRILVVVTHRPTEPAHPVTSALASLARLDGVERLELAGLDEADVRSLLETTDLDIEGPDLDSVARAMRYETGGNPLFLHELVRHLADTAARRAGANPMGLLGQGLPQGVRDVVTARLASLSPEANLLLERAAVVGIDFDHRLLEAVSALRDDELDEALGEALIAGLVEVVPDADVRYRFIHAVVRSAVYDAIAPARRARLHRVVAQALESLVGPATLDYDALAEHWSRAGPAHGEQKAAEYAIRAGRRAQAMLAYETAAARYGQALDALGDPSDPRRGELLLALGESQAAAGEVTAAKQTFERAAAVAVEEGDAEQLARAALGYGVAGVTASVVDQTLVALLERAVTRLPPVDSPLRVKVLARLGAELYFSREAERRRALAEEAVAMARRVGDAEALAFALSAYHYVLWGPDGLDERLAIAREISAVAALTGNTELILQGHRWSIIDLLEQGSIDQADRHIEQYVAIANELRQPLYLWWSRVFLAMRHLLAGRLDEATTTAEEAWRIGRRATDAAMQFFGIQSGFVLRERGHLDTLETAARALVMQFPAVPAWKCALAVFYGDVGRHADAQAIVDEMAAAGFEDLPTDLGWLPAMANLSDVCAEIGDRERAEMLYRLLLPYRDRNLVVGAAVACQGSVARPLGRLAALLGRWDEADELFTAAIAANQRMGAPGLVAHTQAHYARALRARREPGDLDKADVLDDAATEAAAALGLTSLLEPSRAV
jgi:tetratricopeptide (TPR) repeat protein